jgi:gluconolactonase
MLLAACSQQAPEEAEAPPTESIGSVERLNPAINALIPESAVIERVATGFMFTEGPLYMPDGYLLFSDVVGNVIYRWSPEGGPVEWRRPGGFDGAEWPQGSYIGSNGIIRDKEGRILVCEHGNHRITRTDADGKVTVIVDSYQGKRLNSPNDVAFKSDGALYFTDPPYGLPKQDEDENKELAFNGVYRLNPVDPGGELTLLNDQMTRPNGLAFSPDEKYLYVANSDEAKRVWMRYPVQPDGKLGAGEVFHDATASPDAGLPDGMKVDAQGNLYCTGPGGVWIFSPDGTHLGTIKLPEQPANVGWGKAAATNAEGALAAGEEAKVLYITAVTSVYRIPTSVAGKLP